MTLSDFHELALNEAVTIPGIEFEDRHHALDGSHSQTWTARRDSEAKGTKSLLIKLIDASWFKGQDPLKTHTEATRKTAEFTSGLSPDERDLFIMPEDQGCTYIGEKKRPVFYRVMPYSAAAKTVKLGGDQDAAEIEWWRTYRANQAGVITGLRRITRAFELLKDRGYNSVSCSIHEIIFVEQNGAYRPKIMFYGQGFLTSEKTDLVDVPVHMRPLHRIHPGLLGREPSHESPSQVFTLGFLYFQILFNEYPFHRPGYSVVTERQLSVPDSDAQNPLYELVERMLDRRHPGNRPSLEQVSAQIQSDECTHWLQTLPSKLRRREIPVKHMRQVSRPIAFFRLIRRVAKILGWTSLFLIPLGRRKGMDDDQQREFGRALAEFFQDFGALLVKLGQLLATRKDLLSEPIREELEKLKNDNPEVPFEKVESLIRQDWDVEDVDEALLYLEAEPLGVASMGQVHRGRMRLLSNVDVAIKIRKPGIREQLTRDLKWLNRTAGFLEKIPVLKSYQIPEIVQDFTRSIEDELTFASECRNLNEVAANFVEDDTVRFPQVFLSADVRRVLEKPKLSAPDEVMCMGFMAGSPIIDKDGLTRIGIRSKTDRVELARNIIRSFLRMVIVHGTYHADPHPGNVFGLAGNRVGWIDLGSVGRLTDRQKLNLFLMLRAVTSQDSHLVVRVLQMMGALDPAAHHDRLEVDIKMLLTTAHALAKAGDTSAAFSQTLQEMTLLIQQHRVSVPSEMALLFRAISEVEGTVSKLANDLDIADELQQEIMRVGLPIIVPTELQTAFAAGDWKAVLTALPKSLPARVLTGMGVDAYVFRQNLMRTQAHQTQRDKADLMGPAFVIGLGCVFHWMYAPLNSSPAWWSLLFIGVGSIWGFGNLIRR